MRDHGTICSDHNTRLIDPTSFDLEYYNRDVVRGDVEIGQWMNLNSLLARLTGTITQADFEWAYLPITQISERLEHRLENTNAKLVDSKIWICTEWLLHAARNLNQFLCDEGNEVQDDEPGEESVSAYLATGPLAVGVPVLSTERWNFWIARLEDMVGRSTELDQRIAETRQNMERIKAGASS